MVVPDRDGVSMIEVKGSDISIARLGGLVKGCGGVGTNLVDQPVGRKVLYTYRLVRWFCTASNRPINCSRDAVPVVPNC
jgi:hypothetical protein